MDSFSWNGLGRNRWIVTSYIHVRTKTGLLNVFSCQRSQIVIPTDGRNLKTGHVETPRFASE